MNLELIINEIKKQLPEDVDEYSNYKKWKTYHNFSGYYNGCYFDLYFRETLGGRQTIEVCHTTENPMVFVEMIKDIDKKAIVTYTKTTKIEVTI